MKIAYLILAFKQPHLLIRMIDRLNQSNAHFYVHFDKKSKDLAEAKVLAAKYPNVTLIATNSVYWSGFSMVQAELDMLTKAYSSGIDFKYYLLLSGQDYPIKSNEYINDFFEKHNTDFITFHKVSHLDETYINKFRYFHFYDIPFINPRSEKKIKFLSYLYFGAQKHLRKLMPKRRIYNDLEPYFGGVKTALTHGTVKYIVEFIKEHKGFLRFMKYTETPDETFFQTIVLNSERRNNIYQYDKYTDWLKTRRDGEFFIPEYSTLRYMDWSETGKPKPATLDISYFETLKESKELFGRKFDEKISAQLMDKMDSEILGKPKWIS